MRLTKGRCGSLGSSGIDNYLHRSLCIILVHRS